MNERIQELFNQAAKEADAEYQRIYDQGFATSWKNIFGRIYAELIVKECIAMSTGQNQYKLGFQLAKDFSNHFGVK